MNLNELKERVFYCSTEFNNKGSVIRIFGNVFEAGMESRILSVITSGVSYNDLNIEEFNND